MRHVKAVLILGSLLSSVVLAKDFDDMKPTRPQTVPLIDDTKANKPAPAPAQTTTPAQPQPTPDAAATATATTAAATEAKPVVIPPSELSKKLDGKLGLGLGYGFTSIPSADVGSFAAFGGADVRVAYQVYSRKEGAQSMHIDMRYAPIQAEGRIKGQSIRAMIEGYYLGSSYLWRVAQSLGLFAGIELGYLMVSMQAEDRLKVTDEMEKDQLAYGIKTGLDWFVQQKIKIGPSVHVGFGKYRIVQCAGALSVLF